MESLVMNIGLLILIILWAVAVFTAPITAAMLASGLFLFKIGVAGYKSDPAFALWAAGVGIAIDVYLWKFHRGWKWR